MKKVLSLVLVLAMVLGSFSFVFAAPNDVAGTVYENAVARLSLLGILTGYPDGTFKPENQITRAEFAAVAIRAKGLEASAQAAKGLATGFSDVPASHWASGYVGTAAKLGIVNGVGNGKFAPEAPVKYEEAITMLVRALNYEPAAKAKGGYPYGYLIVANENGLLDAVKGTQGVAATRGIVAQLTDNALEIPMMVQVGFGSEAKWVVSGTKEHGGDERYLLDDMGFETYEGRVVSVNTKRNEITLDNEDEDLKLKDKTVKAGEGFDFYSVEGLTIKVWYTNDAVILYTVKDEAKFDATSYVEKDKEIKLITEDETYEVAKDAALKLNGDKVKADKFKADYAKIVLNDDDKIIWAEGYTLDSDLIVVKDVKGDVINGYGDNELKVKDFTIAKEGKTVKVEDLEDGEVVLYNSAKKFAVVATATKTGKIERVYSDSFKFDGDNYDNDGVNYFDGKNLDQINPDVLKELADDEDEVVGIFNFKDEMVVLSGEDKNADASTFYAVLLNDAKTTIGRRGAKQISFDVRTADGSKKAIDLSEAFVIKHKLVKTKVEDGKDVVDYDGDQPQAAAKGDLKTNVVIKMTVDKDGEPTKIAFVEGEAVNKDGFKVSATHAKGTNYSYRLASSTVVFYNENKKAIKVGDIKDEFEVIKEGTIFYESGKAVAIVATKTNEDTDSKPVVGLLTEILKLRSGAYEFTVKVEGNKETYVSESTSADLPGDFEVGELEDPIIVELRVGEKSNKVVLDKDNNKVLAISAKAPVSIVSINRVVGRRLTVTGGTYNEYGLVDNFKIYDAQNKYAEIKDAKKLEGRKAKLYSYAGSKYEIAYVITTDKVEVEGEETTLEDVVTVRGNIWVTIKGEKYLYGGSIGLETLENYVKDKTPIEYSIKTVDGEEVVTLKEKK